MNRYKSSGPSKASASTLCQKCLKRGHYSYECTASQQDRPYAPRPSRTQQLLNPKLAPKIVAEAPKRAEPSIDHTRKRGLDDAEQDTGVFHVKRPKSVSSSSDSVSTISTRSSLSQSPPAGPPSGRDGRRRRGSSAGARESAAQSASRRRSRSPPHRYRRTASKSSSRSVSRERPDKRNDKPPRKYRSRSPYRPRSRGYVDGQQRATDHNGDNGPTTSRKRSLSPYSRRLALTGVNSGNH